MNAPITAIIMIWYLFQRFFHVIFLIMSQTFTQKPKSKYGLTRRDWTGLELNWSEQSRAEQNSEHWTEQRVMFYFICKRSLKADILFFFDMIYGKGKLLTYKTLGFLGPLFNCYPRLSGTREECLYLNIYICMWLLGMKDGDRYESYARDMIFIRFVPASRLGGSIGYVFWLRLTDEEEQINGQRKMMIIIIIVSSLWLRW